MALSLTRASLRRRRIKPPAGAASAEWALSECQARRFLSSDLRLVVHATGDGAAKCRFETEHTQTPPTLRERGSFVTTIVDGVDRRFRAWGIDPPDAYRYTATADGSHRYEGRLDLP